MNLTCIGRYGPYPKAGFACTCYLIKHQGKNVVLDLGCGALTQLLKIMRAEQIDALVLSHLHADHMGDALTLRYALEVARKMGHREEPLPVYMPDTPAEEAGLLSSHAMIDARFVSDGFGCEIGGMQASFALMPHAVPSYAVALEAEGKKIVYSGDTRDGERLVPFAKGADILLLEAAILSQHKTPGVQHVTALDAGYIGADAGAKKLIVTHIFPEYDENEILAEVRRGYLGAELAKEFAVIEV